MNLPFASRTNSLYLRALALSSTLATACLFGINPQPKSPPAYNPASPDCTACGSGKGGPEGNCPGSFRYSFNLGQTRLSQRPGFLEASRAGIKETHGGQSGYRAFDQLRSLSFSTAPHATQSDRIIISQSRVNSALYDPFVIRFYPHPKASYVSEKGTLRQVLTDDSLTMVEPVVELNATDANSTIPVGFRIKLWPRSALSTTRKVNGAYPLPENEPQAIEYFRNPDHPAQNNRLLLTSSDLSDPANPLHTTTLYDQSAPEVLIVTTLRGDDLDGTLLRRQTLSYLSRGPHANDRIFERSVEEASLLAGGALGPLQIVSTVREQYADFDPTPEPYSAPDGQKPARQDWNNDQRLLQRIIDPDTDHKQVTTWEYFQDANNSNIHGRLKSVRRPDGSWERWEYADQGQAVVIEKRYSSWKDVTFDNYQQGRLQETIINASEVTRTTLVEGTVISLVVSRTETDPEGMLLHTEEARVDGQSHLSVSAFHPANAGGLLAQRPAYRISLDGTLTTWEYKQLGGGGLRITTRTGLGELPAFAHGTKTISTYDRRQNLLSEESRDLATDRLLGKRVGSDFDPQGIPTKWTLDDDPTRYSLTIPGPHGPTFERSPDGSTATYSYDPLGRVSQVDRQPSANGPVLSTLRTQDANVTTSHLTDGATTLLQSSVTTQFGEGGNCCGGSGSSSHLITRSPDADGDGQPELSTRLILLDPVTGRTVISTAPDGSTRNSAHYLDGQLKSLSGTAQPDQSFDYGVHQENGGGLWTRVYQNNLTQWTTTYRDALGRPFRTTLADGSSGTRTYYSSDAPAGSRGRLHTVTDPDGTTLIYSYDAKGQATFSTPLPGARAVLTRNDSDVVEHPQLETALRTRSYRNEQLLSTTWTTPDGTRSLTNSLGNLSIQTSPHPQDGARTHTQVAPNGVISHELHEDGRLLASLTLSPGSALPDTFTGFADLLGLVSGTSYAYDSFGRLLSSTDSRTGTTTIGPYLENGSTTQTTDPGGRVTTFAYDVMGRQVSINLPDTLDANGVPLANLTNSTHYPTGQPKATWGGQATPTLRLYDEQGRLTELRTYPDLASGTEPTEATPGHQSTRWIYDNKTGNLLQKLDHQGNGPTYGYTAGGKLETRRRARETITTYAYEAGLLSSGLHDDQGETPGLAYAYDDLGRVSTVTQGDNQWTYAYDPVHHGLTTETITYANGFTRQINHSYDALHRHSAYSLRNGQLTENTASYQRDALGRLSTLASGNDGFQYDYLDQAPHLLEQVSGPAHQVQNAYDATRYLLLEKHNLTLANQSVSRFSYSVNALGQRTSLVTSGSAFEATAGQTNWGYDELGQLVQADHNTSDQNDRAYHYDKLGNRIHATDDQGTTQYQTNELNQYLSAGGTNYQYDDDGNLVSDGLRTYHWNANNRLIEVKLGTVSLATYAYDHQGRRISKSTPQGTTQFVYDGWLLLAEYSETEGAPISLKNSYLWGPDLSGSFQGAGGVGGLLSVSDENGTTYYATYDGNGNVSEYLNEDGEVTAHYEYDPFGRTVTQSGDRAQSFSFRFSTKYQDTETGFYYYGYRYYDTTTGRWLSRDPIQEQGGLNLYGFVGNDGVNAWDLLGMVVVDGITIRRFAAPGGHQWITLHNEEFNLAWMSRIEKEKKDLIHFGVNKAKNKKVVWLDEMVNRPRSDLENPSNYYEWQVKRKYFGKLPTGKPCKCATSREIIDCIKDRVAYEFLGIYPTKNFNIFCNNCRRNSKRVIKLCCGKKGKIINNPDKRDALQRFFRDYVLGPRVYLSEN